VCVCVCVCVCVQGVRVEFEWMIQAIALESALCQSHSLFLPPE